MIQKTSPRITRKRQQRLEQILATALEMILQEGLEHLTMQKLAERLDYAVGALYRYFSSKDALLAALQRQVLQELTDLLLSAWHWGEQHWQQLPSPQRALLQIELAASVYSQLRQLAPRRFLLLHEMIVAPQPLLSVAEGLKGLQVALPLLQHISGLFSQASEQQALSSGQPQSRAILLWAGLQGLVPMQKLSRYLPGSQQALQQELLQTLLLGWGASPSELQPLEKQLKKAIKTKGYLALFAALEEA